ncbi:hypothetical protein F442_11893, partial [Phytophthora nicotianae P10297]
AFFTILVAGVALLASSEGLLLTTESDQSQITQLGKNTQLDKRFLRVGTPVDPVNNEERTWARINGIDLTKPQAKEWLQDWVRQGKSMKYVAQQMGLYNLKEADMLRHINFEALRKFVRMDFKARTGRKLPKGDVTISF